MSTTLTRASQVIIRDSLLFREIEGQAVLLETESGTYFGLDEVGTRMFSLLARHGDLEVVLERLLAEYDVDSATLERDLLNFAQLLQDQELVHVGAA